MQQYLDLLNDVRKNGREKSDRTGTGTYSVFGRQMRFNLGEGFPIVTTKKIHTRSVIHELIWFLKGETNVGYLRDNRVTIWDEWADKEGNLGPVYGKQWRDFGGEPNYGASGLNGYHRGIDQISEVQEQIRKNPFSRRHIVSAWNPIDIPKMALAPCHCLFQFNVNPMTDTERQKIARKKTGQLERGFTVHEMDEEQIPKTMLDCQLYQRSADIFLGVPFNISSYALLTLMMAQTTGNAPGEFVHSLGDLHLYKNHVEQADTQLSRTPLPLPTMKLNPEVRDILDFKFKDFSLEGYESHPAIQAPIAV